jgi:hypothetical protein
MGGGRLVLFSCEEKPMISSSDLPACAACGCRDVHPITKPKPKTIIEGLADAIAADPNIPVEFDTFYACRQCGRDVTDAWSEVQPEKIPKPKSIIGVDLAGDEPDRTEVTVVEPHALGIGATNGSKT